MHFGVSLFATDYAASPGVVAKLLEERGFESLWVPEHTHIPVSRTTPYPVGGELPREYSHTLDPFVALTAAAAATSRLRIGTAICLLVQRDPIITAKAVASLDHLSGGRFLFGIGGGWNIEEIENHGVDAARRFGVLRERIEAMQQIWTREEASYHGRHVDFDGIWSWPKPVQKPYPPILLGGNGRTVYERVLAYADEWLPNNVGDAERLAARIAKLHRLAAEAGRKVGVTLHVAPTDPVALERYAQAGVGRAIFLVPPTDAGETERRLDRLAALVAQYCG
ncbi:MAG: LLM class F420-dependent oxidoreductase [Solirubrobacteraceae bacterium]